MIMKTNRIICTLCLIFILFNQCSDHNPKLTCLSYTFPSQGSLVPENSTITFTWTATTGAKVYDVYLESGSNEPERIASDIVATSYDYTIPPGEDLSYRWFVKPKNAAGNAVGCNGKSISFTSNSLPAIDEEQKVVNVLVVNYDPDISLGSVTKKLHEYYGWSNPRTLADEFIQEVLNSSGNLIQYNIVEWRDINEFPVKSDGFVYTSSSYMLCHQSNSNCHAADGLNYTKMITDQNIVEGIDQDVFEEVWIFGAPYFGFWEAAMAGPNAFNINGDIYPQIPSKKAFAIMGFNYERGVTEMMHDLCHRTEGTMSRVYGGWQAEVLNTSWAKFAANEIQSKVAGVGSCHYPPNAKEDYDYANDRLVSSSAEDWMYYPLSTGKRIMVNNATWGAPDHEGKYLNWWFKHLPKRVGIASDGKLNCWWRYIFEFNETILQ
ncbi:MAG TPA: hypothetical protein PLJ60_16040 [Chryseolinea sp.]|nr:hypothetical protein [Chryseolinea sp.]